MSGRVISLCYLTHQSHVNPTSFPNILYRSTGVYLGKIGEQGTEQLSLYSDTTLETKKKNLAKCFDNLESKFGKNIIQTGFHYKKRKATKEK